MNELNWYLASNTEGKLVWIFVYSWLCDLYSSLSSVPLQWWVKKTRGGSTYFLFISLFSARNAFFQWCYLNFLPFVFAQISSYFHISLIKYGLFVLNLNMFCRCNICFLLFHSPLESTVLLFTRSERLSWY